MDPQYAAGTADFKAGYIAGLVAGAKAVSTAIREQVDELEAEIPELIRLAAENAGAGEE